MGTEERGAPHLRHKQHDQSDIGGEHYGKRRKGEGCVLLAGQDHGDRGSDEAQDLWVDPVWDLQALLPRERAHEEGPRGTSHQKRVQTQGHPQLQIWKGPKPLPTPGEPLPPGRGPAIFTQAHSESLSIESGKSSRKLTPIPAREPQTSHLPPCFCFLTC